MKYYIYISDAKVDMLLPQIPHEVKKKVATEFGFDLKILTAKRTVERKGEDDRISRLETVLQFIRQYGNCGTIDNPDEYIDDSEDMWFGNYDLADVAYFTGKRAETVFGLCGSGRHLLGADPNRSPWPNMTHLLGVFSWLSDQNPTHDGNGINAIPVLAELASRSHFPRQRLEFLAKRLVFNPHYSYGDVPIQVLLASPLYVSMMD
jgi:hypothetical protein